MATRTTAPIAARWVWVAVLGSAVLATLSHVLGGSATEGVTGVLIIATLLGVVYLLYRWGQVRGPASPDDTDREEHRREQEMKAEAGGFGGNGGGL